MNEPFVLKQSVIEGHHFWGAPNPLPSLFFCSDELLAWMKQEDIGHSILRKCTVKADE